MTDVEVEIRQSDGSGIQTREETVDMARSSEPLLPPLLLANLKKLAKVLVATLGHQCEVVIHDLYDLERSVVWIEGDVTRRKPGAPMTDLGIEKIQKGEFEDLPNYRTETPNGKTLKSSSTFIINEEGEAIGAFCINWDVTALNTAQQILDSMTQLSTDTPVNELFVEDAAEIIERSVEAYVVDTGKPLSMMNKADKVELVHFLDQKGLFQLQRAVPIMADLLKVSRQTVYNYLEEANRS